MDLKASTIPISPNDKMFLFLNNCLLGIIMLVVLYPLIFVVSSSFSSPNANITGKVWLYPVDVSFEGYKAVFSNKSIMTGYANTIFYTIFGTLISVTLTVLAAYPLSRSDFKPRNVIMLLFAFTMFFSGGLIPTYILVKELGMLDTRWAMLIPSALSVFNIIITRSFFQGTPSELLEASQMDGCSDFRYLGSILLPLSKPILAVMTLFYAVAQWNAFFDALLYLSKEGLQPLQIVLRQILVSNNFDAAMMNTVNIDQMVAKQGISELLKYSLIIVASIPLLVVYPFIQKYFVKGIMIGAIKG
ncbi:carbohydrate ABC transporter permease [Paenibacillus eucommiae]|uniref:carbohydrate ABC transporter permease n=1 Tax=Paenibacillus eucommiae TaxID=1355755 RepID=UPI001AEA4DE3